jgi:hypothetical protein
LKVKHDLSVLSIAVPCALAALFAILFLSSMPFNRDLVAKRDFITYWATGQQLVHHANPYDAAAVSRIERDAGFEGGASYYMRNAPWALPLALPLGYVGPQAAALPWSLLMLGLLIASARMLWKVFGQSGTRLDWIGYCFPPALFCVILGQTSIFLLLGLALFLRLHKSRPFAAGAALWFCTLKPHLFLPFVLVLLVWIAVSRSYRILLGSLAAFAAAAAVTSYIDPAAWSQYAFYMRTSVVTREFTPCLGDVLRDSIHPSAEWLAFVPAMAACVWALAWFWPRRHTWDWLENGNLLVLVSLFVAPFGWIFDQTLAIPGVLFAISRGPSRIWIFVLALIYLLIEFEIGFHVELHSRAFLWIAPAWIVWYLFARASASERGAAQVAVSESPV